MSTVDLVKGVTIVIPTGGYAGQVFDQWALDSLRLIVSDIENQALQPKRIIVSINGNQPKAVVDQISTIFSRLQNALILNSAIPLSASENWLRGASLVSTEFFCFWSDHDRRSPLFLQRCKEFLRANPWCGLVVPASYCENWNDSSRITSQFNPNFYVNSASAVQRVVDVSALFEPVAIHGLMKTEVFAKIERGNDCRAPDILFLIDFAQHAGVARLPESEEPLMTFRSRPTAYYPKHYHRQIFSRYSPVDCYLSGASFSIIAFLRSIRRSKIFSTPQKYFLSIFIFARYEITFSGRLPFVTIRELAYSFARLFIFNVGAAGRRGDTWNKRLISFVSQFSLVSYGLLSGSYLFESFLLVEKLAAKFQSQGLKIFSRV